MIYIDWAIVGAAIVVMVFIAMISKKYTKSVADFLAANRCAGRYLLAVAEGMAVLGAISIIGLWEMYYEAGFSADWWMMMVIPASLIIAVSGFVIYRYRETKAMTLAEFFEIRYSKRLRIFAGILCFVSGVINFGIFPGVGARFFIYYADLSAKFTLLGISISTFPVVMALLLLLSLALVWMGGQIAVMVADFVQGLFSNIVLIIVLIVIFYMIPWSNIGEALGAAPEGKSMINPFESYGLKDFNVWYFLIGVIGSFYSFMSWQGTQGYNCSAKNPHEAKMGKIVGSWRYQSQVMFFLMVPIVAYTLMHHVDFSSFAESTNETIGQISSKCIRSQMTVPIILSKFLPVGVKGAVFAVMLAAFVSTHDTYLHSWGSIFIQDVIVPFRKEPLTAKKHLWLLRFSATGVAIFIFFFSLFYEPTEAILMFFALTGAIFLGGSGAVLIGGLYWKKGTSNAAWTAMITGSSIAFLSFALRIMWPKYYQTDFPINSQWIYALTMLCSTGGYVIVSLWENKVFNMDKMLHRGIYALEKIKEEDEKTEDFNKLKGKLITTVLYKLGLSKEFSRWDKVIFYSVIIWGLGWFSIFCIVSLCHCLNILPDGFWMKFWIFKVKVIFMVGFVCTIWIAIGGIKDLRYMFKTLRSSVRDDQDDGMVK